MMWMGLVSAWGAIVVGALFAAMAALYLSWGDVNWVAMVAAALLLTGGVRTLRKMSGGLRLLAGAWGLAAGLMMMPYTSVRDVVPNENTYSVDLGLLAVLVVALPWISLAGLALTVLHQERK